jgi:hypothetical protein
MALNCSIERLVKVKSSQLGIAEKGLIQVNTPKTAIRVWKRGRRKLVQISLSRK